MAINRIYSLYNTSDTNEIPIQKISNFIRYSVDGTQLIVEWTQEPPVGTVILTHEEAKSITSGPDWTPEDLESTL
jgi:hypothetical protein